MADLSAIAKNGENMERNYGSDVIEINIEAPSDEVGTDDEVDIEEVQVDSLETDASFTLPPSASSKAVDATSDVEADNSQSYNENGDGNTKTDIVECVYWDEKNSKWVTVDADVEITDGEYTCETPHFTSFTVIVYSSYSVESVEVAKEFVLYALIAIDSFLALGFVLGCCYDKKKHNMLIMSKRKKK